MAYLRTLVRVATTLVVLGLLLCTAVGAAGASGPARPHPLHGRAAATAAPLAAVPGGALAQRVWVWLQGWVGATPQGTARHSPTPQAGGCQNPDGSPCT
jgi:hypothetical protein